MSKSIKLVNQNTLRYLTQSLLVMVEEGEKELDNVRSNFGKELSPKGKTSIVISNKGEKLISRLFISTEAYTVYAFSLYERYLAELLKDSLHSNKDLLQKYKSRWASLFDRKNAPSNISTEILFDEDTLIAQYYDLKQNITRLISSLLGIKTREIDNSLVIENLAKFDFLIEARNLFVHRGSLIDQLFLKKVKEKRILKENPLLLEQFMDELYLSNKIEENNEKELLNKPVHISLYELAPVLIFNACWMTIHFSKLNDKNQIIESYNEVSEIALGSGYRQVREISILVFDLIKQIHFNNKIKKMSDASKFNYFLTIYELTSFYESYICRESKNIILSERFKKEIIKNKEILNTFDKDLFSDNDNYRIELLRCYIENEKESFIEVFKANETDLSDDSNWRESFIFRRWMSDLE